MQIPETQDIGPISACVPFSDSLRAELSQGRVHPCRIETPFIINGTIKILDPHRGLHPSLIDNIYTSNRGLHPSLIDNIYTSNSDSKKS